MKPTIRQIKKADKEKYKKNGIIGILTRKCISSYITWILVRTGITPNQITIFAFLLALAGVYLLTTANPLNLIYAGILIFLSKVFDSVDGQIARVKKITNPKGAWFDTIVDRFKEALIIFGVCFALTKQTGEVMIWVYGFAALVSVYMLHVVLSGTGEMDKKALRKTHSKFFLTKLIKKLGISSQFLAIQSDTYLFITAVLIALNQLIWILWFFMVVINLYWVIIFLFIYFTKK
jgi:phosphatidylglycerophosphate synthase